MIPFNKPVIVGKELDYIAETMASGKTSGNGPFTRKCQAFFEENYGYTKCLLTTSGTDALEMAAILASRKQPKSSRTALEAKRPLWPWLTAGGILLAGGGAGIWYFSQKDNPAPAPTSYQVQLDWSSAP